MLIPALHCIKAGFNLSNLRPLNIHRSSVYNVNSFNIDVTAALHSVTETSFVYLTLHDVVYEAFPINAAPIAYQVADACRPVATFHVRLSVFVFVAPLIETERNMIPVHTCTLMRNKLNSFN